MKLFIVERLDPDYDTTRSHVVRANDEDEARQVCLNNRQNTESEQSWLDAEVTELEVEGAVRIVHTNFLHS